ncbi:helix-turn-helix domain-containing protein [Bacillus toyonensis]|uniref:helix-turn-helix domain-containing protein n=1 Tax=Bacillus toyonensis TaxID=155322 RepID=UPI00124DD27E|nr:helix-turn-helix domain-containing protein [Bacillus toyonensis]KAB2379574.1 HTH domain-containing protein [Bacillus toyonensis]
MEKHIITKRQFLILKHLEGAVGWISSEELGVYIGCSYKTIQNEIKIIKKFLPENWILYTKKGYGMKLIHPQYETVASIFIHDHKELIFQLLNLLVERRSYSTEELGELLYINRNITVELLKKVEQMIKPFFLTLKSRPYYIEGNEGAIRLLLFEILFLTNGNSYFQSFRAHQKISLKFKLKLKLYLEETHGIALTHFGMNLFLNFLSICILRGQKGFEPEELPFGVEEKLIQQGYFKEFNGLFLLLEEMLDYEIPIKERVYIYLALIFSEFEYINSFELALEKYSRVDIVTALQLFSADKGFRHLHVPQNECKEFLEFLHFLKEYLEYDFLYDKTFVIKMFSLYCIAKVRSVLPELQYSPKRTVLTGITNEYPIFSKEVAGIQSIWEEKKAFKCHNKVTMSFTLLLLQYITAEKNLYPNVLYVTSRSQIISDFSLNNMNRHFKGKANLKMKFVWELYESAMEFENIDLIITDTVLPFSLKDIPIILIENNLSNKALADIDYAIDRCMKKKDGMFFENKMEFSNPKEKIGSGAKIK